MYVYSRQWDKSDAEETIKKQISYLYACCCAKNLATVVLIVNNYRLWMNVSRCPIIKNDKQKRIKFEHLRRCVLELAIKQTSNFRFKIVEAWKYLLL